MADMRTGSRCSAVMVAAIARALAKAGPYRLACYDLDGCCIDVRTIETDVVCDGMIIRLPGFDPYRIEGKDGLLGMLVLDRNDDIVAFLEAFASRWVERLTIVPVSDMFRIEF